MPECSACGSTDVAVRTGKNGKPYLIDTRRPHFCPKRPKNGAKPKKAVADPVVALVVGWLRDGGYGKDDAEKWVAAVKGTFGPEDADVLYVKALAGRDAQMAALKKRGAG